MGKIEEIKAKMAELADAAYQAGVDDTAAKCEAKMAEAVKAAEDKAYLKGCEDTRRGLDVVAQGEAEAEKEAEGQQTGTAADIDPADDGALPEYELTNLVVRAFLEDKAYDGAGFATGTGKSVVDKYCLPNMVEGDYWRNWQEQPIRVHDLRNLIPGGRYKFRGQEFLTTGTVRMIDFGDGPGEYVSNCRDLGGWPCEGGHVAYGKVIRSAHLPEGLTKDSPVAKVLRDEVGVTCEIDLRGKSAYTNLGWSGVKYSIAAYTNVMTKTMNLKPVFTRILTEVEKGGCALVHCSAGADRTGTVAALLLGVLGVSEGDIIRDWELTSFCHWCNFKRISDWDEREVIRKECPEGELRQFFRAMAKAYAPKGESFQQQCRSYLVGKGILTAAQIDRLKKAMIE